MYSHTQLDITVNINGFNKRVFQILAVIGVFVEYLFLQDLFDKIKPGFRMNVIYLLPFTYCPSRSMQSL